MVQPGSNLNAAGPAVMRVNSMSGTDWQFQLVNKLDSRKDSAVSLMLAVGDSENAEKKFIVKRQVVGSETELEHLLTEISAWKKACSLARDAMKQFGAAPSVLELSDCVILSKKNGSAKNGVMFISEFCPKFSLHEWILKEQPKLDEAAVIHIISQVVSAVYFSHESGCGTHANVSAHTVFVVSSAPMLVKLGGFGLSRSRIRANLPESLRSTTKTDIFLIGALLAFLACTDGYTLVSAADAPSPAAIPHCLPVSHSLMTAV